MKSLFVAAAELEAFLVEQGWRYCFIGGIALQRWGQPRLTNDVDVTILAGFGNESVYVDALLGRYKARITDGRDFALKNRVLLLESMRESRLMWRWVESPLRIRSCRARRDMSSCPACHF